MFEQRKISNRMNIIYTWDKHSNILKWTMKEKACTIKSFSPSVIKAVDIKRTLFEIRWQAELPVGPTAVHIPTRDSRNLKLLHVKKIKFLRLNLNLIIMFFPIIFWKVQLSEHSTLCNLEHFNYIKCERSALFWLFAQWHCMLHFETVV